MLLNSIHYRRAKRTKPERIIHGNIIPGGHWGDYDNKNSQATPVFLQLLVVKNAEKNFSSHFFEKIEEMSGFGGKINIEFNVDLTLI